MEKPGLQYRLATVKAAIAKAGARCFTGSALQGLQAMGLTTASRAQVGRTAQSRHFVQVEGSRMMAKQEIVKLAPAQCPVCGSTGSLSPFEGETMRAGSSGFFANVERLSGARCAVCDEVFLDSASATRFAAAGDDLVMQRRAFDGRELRRVRTKLGLSQDQAAALTGGGHNAFSRYEQGKAQPVAAVRHLFGILDRHPALLEEIQAAAPGSSRVVATRPGPATTSPAKQKSGNRPAGKR